MVSNATKLTIAFVLGIAAYTSVVFVSELLGHPIMSVTNSINILLTLTVAVFAIVQGMAAYSQYEMQKNTNLIENAKNELEKAYAPLSVLLSNLGRTGKHGIRLNENEKWSLDLILATYPLPTNIKEYWKKNVQGIGLVNYPEESAAHAFYHIPSEFRDMINAEYENRFKEYNRLLTKGKSL
jgi:hypothetical protein